MSYSENEAAATRALMKRLLDAVGTDQANHSMVINALANLASNFARKHPCCTSGAGMLFLEMGANLVFQGKQLDLSVSEPPPAGQHLH